MQGPCKDGWYALQMFRADLLAKEDIYLIKINILRYFENWYNDRQIFVKVANHHYSQQKKSEKIWTL